MNLLAFAFDDWVEGCQASWLPVLASLPAEAAPTSLTLVAVPKPAEGSEDDNYVFLGRTALIATAATQIFCARTQSGIRDHQPARRMPCHSCHEPCMYHPVSAGFGGGTVTAREVQLAATAPEPGPDGSRPHFAVMPARRWARPEAPPPATGAPLKMEDTAVSEDPPTVVFLE